ncbi:hypothetical protein FHR32_001213 [Streptosporangium album]|uniref:Uncharacterized protein n=1 Tax=Streptosporangium album TaxID=47479 RepID=A0A7W7RSQ3_9ACTN|nr:DUF6528 family protein [Streptosporangium album]MBB4936908.1 hypothetical protein [Streptosporangium album]
MGILAGLMATVMAGASTGPAGARPAAAIVITEQAGHRILILDADPATWEQARITWEWQPSRDNGFGDLVAGWGDPDEARLRNRQGRSYLLTTASAGLAAMVPYPAGHGGWGVDVGPEDNPHSIDLLPDGNVAVVASKGGWLRLYTASAGPRAASYAQVPLPGGHGVVWDEGSRLLWALGSTQLIALRVGGTPTQPTLTVVAQTPLPSRGGHDLQPVAGRPGHLWVTTARHLYQYSIARRAFLSDYPGADLMDVPGIKSIDDQPSGSLVVSARQRGNLCPDCTDTIALVAPAGSLTLHGSQIYKARWWYAPA